MLPGDLQIFLEVCAFAFLEHVLAPQHLCIVDAEVEIFTSNAALGPDAIVEFAIGLRFHSESGTGLRAIVPRQGLITMTHTLPVARCLVDVVFAVANRCFEFRTTLKCRLARRQAFRSELALGRLPEALYHFPLVLDLFCWYQVHFAAANILGRGQGSRE